MFIAAFSDSATQAELHLATFRRELETNALLRADFPDLCNPARRPRGSAEADNQAMYIAKSGFVFAARGVDSKTLGMKVGTRRPDLLLLDDVEPGEENYSLPLKEKRLGALTDSILPLNEAARVVLVGTVTMPDSIVHDLVRSTTQPADAPQWIRDQNFRCHYFPAILTDPDTGEERSLWPEKWPLTYLRSIRHTRDYAKNYANDPMGRDGKYFQAEDITYGSLPAVNAMLLSIDPAVTSKAKSDFTACAVIGCQPARYGIDAGRRTVVEPKRCEVRYAQAGRVQVGEPLRAWVLAILADHEDIRGVLIETNQGGDAWRAILHDLPVRIDTVHNSVPKEVRAARLAIRYQRREVIHSQPHPQAEAQLVGFPKAPNDDLVDSIGNGVAVFLGQPKTAELGPAQTASYV
jgi:phage terminase large subunit-like protein